jgi:hypothetical protein
MPFETVGAGTNYFETPRLRADIARLVLPTIVCQ